ncbi:hypothetical protein KXW98_002215 [Aspergillus fumigatus]|uniref:Uncharacterized protein n=1 Tax=Aspergillus fumigatus TaxID=746128 RepID=A0A229Y7F0_ASPFM|nr:hypothetical protein KXX45_005625 [Aspergillus fumigatus]KAH1290579.1 hypothetical protein KXX48_007901 [Aspergillus fumigatus]KAH1307482.1 hypothetical protein KXX11_002017 [Aspergillus fumigatus]KAH1313818.1 hypothetical protein KXX47_004235 [Aspergillus fumigatus]KAH1314948.1 hypothetical protein KXX66_006816 [Aspergillus fumigatus]
MADKLKGALHEEADNFKAVAHGIAVSGAYLYPVKGILFFSYHKDLWRPFISRAVQTIGLGLGVTTAMFFFTYVPQAAIMTFTSGPLAPISAALLVLSESSTITNLLARSFVLADALTDTFDGTLVARGHTELVAKGRQIKASGGGAVSRLGRLLNRPLERMRPSALGKKTGPVAHLRYFQLKGWDERKREEWVKKNQGGYTGFGMAAFLFEMIPFASLMFSFTNAVGAALWATDMEKAMQ